MKLFLALIVSIAVTTFVIIYSDRPATPVEAPPVTNPIKVSKKIAFKPDEVTQLTWIYKKESVQLEKNNQWAVQRRLTLLSTLNVAPIPEIADSLGEVIIKTNNLELHGVYNALAFRWSDGPYANQGQKFSEDVTTREIFAEGLWGFKSHVLKICDPKKLKKVSMPDWFIEKSEQGLWDLQFNGKTEKIRPEAQAIFADKLCHVEVDNFDVFVEDRTFKNDFQIVTTNNTLAIEKRENQFLTQNYPVFKSKTLEQLSTMTSLNDLRDSTPEVAGLAMDRSKSQEDRLRSIRGLRGNNSPEALASLRAIIFENTDIDLYRYEAVDSLAVTGTKEAYKIISERLAQVGRSGFELRLARALSSAMGRFFTSDEKTPEDERKHEVNELLKAAQTHPPGKPLAFTKTK